MLILASSLLLGAAFALVDLAASDRAVAAYISRAFDRIGAADGVALALVAEESRQRAFANSGSKADGAALAVARREVAVRMSDMRAQAGDDGAQDRRIAEIAMQLSTPESQRDLEAFESVRAQIVAFRQEERRRIRAQRDGSEARRKTALARALAAMMAGFVAGGLATVALIGRRRRVEADLVDTAAALTATEADANRTGQILAAISAATPDIIY
ncbi:MAG: hypothetical protein Q8M76_06705, partial [Spirochaetaceae bacterium]|nr:hypothetical protein [Spirochaetaceae bacterium]